MDAPSVCRSRRRTEKSWTQEQAAASVNLRSRKTVAQYEQPGRLPSEMKKRLQYRTPVDAFEGDWPRIEQMLKETPGLQAKGLFEWLCEPHPGRYQPAQLSTPQRRLSTWKALHQHTVASLQQVHIPGKVMQTDGSWLNSFGVTIQGNPFRRILIHSVLPHSN